jgi:arylformamidase
MKRNESNPTCQVWDITPMVHEGIAVFPGDTPFQREVLMDTTKGDHLGLSWIKTTLHLGAHADSTSHYHAQGAGIETRSLLDYYGPCFVADLAHVQRGGRILWKDFLPKLTRYFEGTHPEKLPPRILFKTNSFPHPDVWNSDFVSLSPELIHELSQRQVRLVGIDTPSVDPETSKALESHQALFETKMAVLEGLDLKAVPEGFYTLVALPLKIKNADASPVRAILIQENIEEKK